MQGPETRLTLIRKLHDPAAWEAWREFISLYQPIIYRVARRRGLQHADAEDLTQEVLATVGRRLQSFQWRQTGSFRGWLHKITRDLVVNKLTRGPRERGSGNPDVHDRMAQEPARQETRTLLRLEHQRVVLARVAAQIRPTINEATWQSFWMTAVENRSIAEVARLLKKSPGAVRVARCRVLARLRAEVQADDCDFSL